jgi:membrane dipeptidase
MPPVPQNMPSWFIENKVFFTGPCSYKKYFLNTKASLFFGILISATLGSYGQQYHKKAIVIDTHNDFISKTVENGFAFDQDLKGKTHSDLARMKKGGVDVQIFSIFGDGTKGYAHANQEIDSLYAVVARNPKKMMIVKNSTDLQKAVKEKKLGAMMGMEGGHMIEGDLSKLQALYDRGVRYMTLTWNNSTPWASSAADESGNKITQEKRGLNEFGIEVIKKMNELGMMVDLSHVGEQTFLDAISVSTKPVIASHSCAYGLAPVFRNLKDYQLAALKQNKGVVCINFYSGFLDSALGTRNRAFVQKHKKEIDSLRKTGLTTVYILNELFDKYPGEFEEPPLSLLIDHIDYIVKRIGIDHIGLGSDFDGINSAPKELKGVEDFPKISKALNKRGYSKSDIRKILGENVMRVLAENEKIVPEGISITQ